MSQLSRVIMPKVGSPLTRMYEPSGDHVTSKGFSPNGLTLIFVILIRFTSYPILLSYSGLGMVNIERFPSHAVEAKYFPSGSIAPLLALAPTSFLNLATRSVSVSNNCTSASFAA